MLYTEKSKDSASIKSIGKKSGLAVVVGAAAISGGSAVTTYQVPQSNVTSGPAKYRQRQPFQVVAFPSSRLEAVSRPKESNVSPERLVIESLSNKKWDFRTATGIAKEIGIDRQKVEQILSDSDSVRRALANRSDGAPLFTLKSRKPKLQEYVAFAQRILG